MRFLGFVTVLAVSTILSSIALAAGGTDHRQPTATRRVVPWGKQAHTFAEFMEHFGRHYGSADEALRHGWAFGNASRLAQALNALCGDRPECDALGISEFSDVYPRDFARFAGGARAALAIPDDGDVLVYNPDDAAVVPLDEACDALFSPSWPGVAGPSIFGADGDPTLSIGVGPVSGRGRRASYQSLRRGLSPGAAVDRCGGSCGTEARCARTTLGFRCIPLYCAMETGVAETMCTQCGDGTVLECACADILMFPPPGVSAACAGGLFAGQPSFVGGWGRPESVSVGAVCVGLFNDARANPRASFSPGSFFGDWNEPFARTCSHGWLHTSGATIGDICDSWFRAHVVASPSVDHRGRISSQVLSEPRNCSSSWAYAAAGAAEGCVFGDGAAAPLSVQQLLECSPGSSCSGGNPALALAYAIGAGGVCDASSYASCAGDRCSHIRSCATFTRGSVDARLALGNFGLAGALSRAPIAVLVDPTVLQHYVSGVISGPACAFSTAPTHLVLLVAQLNGAFILKNSWGPVWGENGYFRVSDHHPDTAGCIGVASYCLSPCGACSASPI